MSLFLKLAWRNLLRNRRRSLIAGAAIAFSLAALILYDAFTEGLNVNMIRSAVGTYMGDAQIHAKGFRTTLNPDLQLRDSAQIVKRLGSDPLVAHFAPRVTGYAMVASPASSEPVMVTGIDPTAEKNLSKISKAIVQGAFLAAGAEHAALIGDALAKTLQAAVGDRLVVTVSQAANKGLFEEMVRVAGIFHFGVNQLDRSAVFVPLPEAQKMYGVGDAVSEIAVRFRDPRVASDPALPFWAAYSAGGNEALGWPELVPQLKALVAMTDVATYWTAIILLSVAALGIANALLMAFFERIPEFGVLRAIGTRPLQLGEMVLLESASLAVGGIVVGAALGVASVLLLAWHGIDFSGFEYGGVTLREAVVPLFRLRQFTLYPAWTFFFTLVSGVYPAYLAARLLPAIAMRRAE